MTLATLLVCLTGSLVFAQTGTKAALTGLVKDPQGNGIPGATVTVKNVDTGVSTATQTNGSGNWAVPSLDTGTFEVKIALANFKTVTYSKVVLAAGAKPNLITTLEVGAVSESIKVISQTELIDTGNTNVTTTINTDLINNLPQVTKNALNFVTFLPGVNTSTNHVQRSSTIMGLPPSALSISIDGVNVQSQFLKDTAGSSFFAMIRPQTDLVDQVTVSEATPGADSSAGGAVQIKFVTRSGSNQANGSAYEYLRHPSLNTNSFTNTAAFGLGTTDLPKNDIIVNQYGFRQGGPIIIPGLYNGTGKAFYFFNYEEFRLPSTVTRTRTVLAPLAQTGQFVYGCSSTNLTCTQSVNLFAVASAYAATNPQGPLNGSTGNVALAPAILAANKPDPTVQDALAFINQATGVEGFVNTGTQAADSTLKYNTDRNTLAFSYQPPALRAEHIPGGRVDVNLTGTQRVSATYQFQKVNSNPDELNGRESTFPGGSNHGAQYSFRNSGTATLRSTLTANLVNEFGWGFLWDPEYFAADVTPSQFDLTGQFNMNMAGYVTSLYSGAGTTSRNGSNYSFHDTVSWLKGKHSLSFGMNYQQITGWSSNQNAVPAVSLSVDTGLDPIASGGGGVFTTTFFPNATTAELGNARALYALLTGRVTAINGTSRRNPDGTYAYEGAGRDDLHQRETGLFIQDQWHVRSNLTINAGLRYELQFPVVPTTAVYSQNRLSDVCGQTGMGATNPLAVEALKIGLPCQFGVPGFASGGTPYVYTTADIGTNTSVPPASTLVTAAAVGSSKCLNPLLNTSSQPSMSTVAPCPTYVPYTPGKGGWNTDWNNLGPSIGVAWQPNAQHGAMRKLLGDPALATVRASYARSFNVIGISTLQGPLANGPGLTFSSNRNVANNNLCAGGGTNCFPMQFSSSLDAGAIGPPPTCTSLSPTAGCVPTTIQFPLPTNFAAAGVLIFDPNYQTSYADSYSVGLQRSLSKDMSIEVRYVRTRNYGGDTFREYGEQNAFAAPFGSSANFLDEFAKAQQNLAINLKNNNGATFAPKGLPGQSPLPIFLASYTGAAGCGAAPATYQLGGTNAAAFCPGASDATKYTGTQWTNTAAVNALSLISPNPFLFSLTGTSSTSDLFFNPTFRANGVSAGMPLNFWVMNPDTGSNGVEVAQGYTKYDSIQAILTRRLSRGLQVSANYAYQLQYGSSFQTFWRDRQLIRSTAAAPNSFKMLVNYDVPVGKGKRFGANIPTWVDGVIGNWQLNMTARVENGRLVDIGDVRLVNMTLGDVQRAFHYYRNTTPVTLPDGTITVPDNRWYDLPLDIVINSTKAFSVAATATGHPTCTGTNATTCGGADPNSRHFEPASTRTVDASGQVQGCTAIFTGDCGPRQQFITAPLFTRFELSAKKRFPFARRGSFDVEIDALNLFNAIDFNSNLSAAGGTNILTSAYQDISNTFDPGGRLVQLVFRVNW
jgi:hypothetical protein